MNCIWIIVQLIALLGVVGNFWNVNIRKKLLYLFKYFYLQYCVVSDTYWLIAFKLLYIYTVFFLENNNREGLNTIYNKSKSIGDRNDRETALKIIASTKVLFFFYYFDGQRKFIVDFFSKLFSALMNLNQLNMAYTKLISDYMY